MYEFRADRQIVRRRRQRRERALSQAGRAGSGARSRARAARDRQRRVPGYLTGATAVLGLAVGFLMTIINRTDFPALGDGLWWAVVRPKEKMRERLDAIEAKLDQGRG